MVTTQISRHKAGLSWQTGAFRHLSQCALTGGTASPVEEPWSGRASGRKSGICHLLVGWGPENTASMKTQRV